MLCFSDRLRTRRYPRHVELVKHGLFFIWSALKRPIPISMATLTDEVLLTLQKYTACDISDCLLKLNVPKAGYISDLTNYCNAPLSSIANNPRQIIIAPACTVEFTPKSVDNVDETGKSNIPEGRYWVDLVESGSIVVESQPEGQTNAICGGIMALRMKILGVKGIIVHGRIRDVEELEETELMVRRCFQITVLQLLQSLLD